MNEGAALLQGLLWRVKDGSGESEHSVIFHFRHGTEPRIAAGDWSTAGITRTLLVRSGVCAVTLLGGAFGSGPYRISQVNAGRNIHL